MRNAVVFFCLVACAVRFDVKDGQAVVCTVDGDCPDTLPRCSASQHRCIDAVKAMDTQAPSLLSFVTTSSTTLLAVFDDEVVVDGSLTITDAGNTPLPVVSAVPSEDRRSLTINTEAQTAARPYRAAFRVLDPANNGSDITASFAGFGAPPDGAPPALIFPEDGARRAGLSVDLVWLPRAGAVHYAVQIYTDAQAQTLLQTIDTTATIATLTLAQDATVYWRVVADSTSETTSAPLRKLSLLGACVHLSCPMGATCESGIGTSNEPVGTLPFAMETANALRLHCIQAADRGGGAGYPGSLLITQSPFVFDGGWAGQGTRAKIDGDALGLLFMVGTHDITLTNMAFGGSTIDPNMRIAGAQGLLFDNVELGVSTPQVANGSQIFARIDDSQVQLNDVRVFIGQGAPSGVSTSVQLFSVSADSTLSVQDSAFDFTGARHLNAFICDYSTFSWSHVDIRFGTNQGGILTGLDANHCNVTVSDSTVDLGRNFNQGKVISSAYSNIDVTRSVLSGGYPLDVTLFPNQTVLVNTVASDPSLVRVTNSVLICGAGYDGVCLNLEGTGVNGDTPNTAIEAAHNLIVLSRSRIYSAVGVRNQVAKSPIRLVNNLFVTVDVDTQPDPYGKWMCVDERQANARLDGMSRNLILMPTDDSKKVSYFYWGPSGATNILDASLIRPGATGFDGNVNATAANSLNDIDGPDDNLLTLDDNDYTWRADYPRAITDIGRDTTASVCGAKANRSCGNVTDDFHRAPRPASGATVGPFQR